MGKIGTDIINLDVKELTQMLNEALCEEWLIDINRMKEEFRKIRL